MRWMGIDYGDKNIGVAVSDLLGLTAQAHTVIRREDETVIRQPLRRLAEIIEANDIGVIVLGYPKNMDGTEGVRCEKTRVFQARLTKRFSMPVILWDERLSTVGADRGLAHLTRDRRDAVIDKIAAEFILQGYLDSLQHERGTPSAAEDC